ncbi:MAG: DUF389 domain-containing protein, partial [Actinomycetia bacterium]|nr:DUF389 domain-containing protein [Actinomycetes bacterium]
AISIALVPPLSVVGISYAQGDWSSGHGALPLFATNMLAILVMGGLTFVATGVTPVVRVAKNQYRVRTALSAVGVLAALVIGSLLINGSQIASDLVNQSTIDAAVATWIDDHPDHSLVRIDVDGDTITPIISGPSAGSPNAASLATELSRVLDRRVTVQVRLLVEERQTATSGE